MTHEIIAIAADHGGYELKVLVKEMLQSAGYGVLDLGTVGTDSVDYPVYARALVEALGSGLASRGILLCGTGIGMSIAANRYPGIRAALCMNGLMARLARQHNCANVLVLGGRLLGSETAKDCVLTFLETPFEGGRHEKRIAKIDPGT